MLKTKRKAEYKINKLILNRWSPRSMTGEQLSDKELMSLFEAAKWAPSSYNNQPWRFIYAKRNSEYWNKFLDLLVEGNKVWAQNAAVLIVLISRKKFEHNESPSVTHSLDTGAAWQNLALEASSKNLVAHGMEGFDYEKAKEVLKISDNFQVEAMIAVGKLDKKSKLSEAYKKMELPSERKPLKNIIMEGSFKE